MQSPSTFARFAEHYRCRVTRDHCGAAIIRGKFGHAYEHDAGQFGIVLEAPADTAILDNTLRSRKRRAIATGFFMNQEGDIRRLVFQWFTCRDRNRPSGPAWARELGISHIWLQKLVREFKADPSKMCSYKERGVIPSSRSSAVAMSTAGN